MNKLSLLWFGVLVVVCVSLAEDTSQKGFDKAVSDVSKSLKGIWDGGKKFVEGMGQSFGVPPGDQKNNFIVFNDAPKAIAVAKQRVTGVMGAKFSGNIDKKMTLKAGENSGNTFNKVQLYASVWLCGDRSELDTYAKSSSEGAEWGLLATPLGAALGGIIGGIVVTEELKKYKIFRRDLGLGKKNDPNWYYYRTYTYQGKVQGEYLGVKAKSNEFAGVFLNSTNESNIYLSFTKDGIPYTVHLEPNSYSLLQSTAGVSGSIRPKAGGKNAFQFYNTADKTFTDATSIAYIPIAEIGIANIVIDSATKKQKVSGPMTYTYEVHMVDKKPTVGIQGLAVGHYNQPCSSPCKAGQLLSKVRDINPAQCHIWRMSAKQQAQAQATKQAKDSKNYSSVYYDGDDQVWVSYKSKDFIYQKKMNPEDVFDVGIIRPHSSEKQAILYVVSLQTTDDTVAKKFLDRIHTGKIGQGAVYTKVTADNIKQFLADETKLLQPNTNGIIDDTDTKKDVAASGIKGEVLLADVFTPRGVGIGPFYYIVQPSSLQVGALVGALTTGLYLDDAHYTADRLLKDTVMKDLSAKFVSWVELYNKDKDMVKSDVLAYLQQNGNPDIFINPKASPEQRKLNDAGNRMLNDVLTGPISIANSPLIRQAGKNYYVYTLGDAPGNWPPKKTTK